jgi:hypothetical protein
VFGSELFRFAKSDVGEKRSNEMEFDGTALLGIIVLLRSLDAPGDDTFAGPAPTFLATLSLGKDASRVGCKNAPFAFAGGAKESVSPALVVAVGEELTGA